MNNRYLFRAKTKLIVGEYNFGKKDGEWVEGYLRCDCGRYTIYQFEFDRANYIDYEVDPTTICQCTGREGEFEHDIFECDGIRYEIVFDEYDFEWDARSVFDASETISLGEFGKDSYIPLGNSIDNPELLEVE